MSHSAPLKIRFPNGLGRGIQTTYLPKTQASAYTRKNQLTKPFLSQGGGGEMKRAGTNLRVRQAPFGLPPQGWGSSAKEAGTHPRTDQHQQKYRRKVFWRLRHQEHRTQQPSSGLCPTKGGGGPAERGTHFPKEAGTPRRVYGPLSKALQLTHLYGLCGTPPPPPPKRHMAWGIYQSRPQRAKWGVGGGGGTHVSAWRGVAMDPVVPRPAFTCQPYSPYAPPLTRGTQHQSQCHPPALTTTAQQHITK